MSKIDSHELSFTEIEVVQGNFKVVWEWIGEGNSGDYQDNSNDTPLLRFSCYQYRTEDEGNGFSSVDWYQMDDASYCTRMPISSPVTMLCHAAGFILEAIKDINYKKELERLSWFHPKDFDRVVS